MTWYAWTLVVLFIINALATVAYVGKRRAPITPGTAVATVIINALYVWAVLALAAS